MANRKYNLRNTLTGLACFGILYYILYGDSSRLPTEWLGSTPHNLLTSSATFLFWMLLIYFLEGTKAVDLKQDSKLSPVRHALSYYFSYWAVCVPLVVAGHFFFFTHSNSPIYCPMFVNLGFLNLSRAVVALSNNIHEGTWLVSSIAICAFCASLYARLDKKGRKPAAILLLVGGVAVQALLYLVIMPFRYHKVVFRIAAVIGPVFYMAGFLLFRHSARIRRRVEAMDALEGGRATRILTAPFRFAGSRWLSFWMVQFYFGIYFFNFAASAYQLAGSALGSYLIIALSVCCFILLEKWVVEQVAIAYRQSKWSLLAVLPLLGLPFLLRLALEVSMDNYAQFAWAANGQWPHYVMITVFAMLCLVMLLRAITGHWLVSSVILSVLMTVLGIVNHYTMKYHGTLVTVEDLSNIQTAANVASSYDFSIDEIAGKVLLYGGAGLACCVAVWLLTRAARKAFSKGQHRINRAICLVTAAGGLFMCYFAPVPLVARQDNVWSWGSLYAKIGFFSGTVESTMANLAFSVRKPEGYSRERIAELKDDAQIANAGEPASAPQDEYVDIIMILNETWYNLDNYIDTHADVDYLSNYKALGNAIKGYTEVPLTGGGTNGTEYEMLTANSMSLVNAYAPFNRLNFNDTMSLPRYLKQLGYATIAAHPHQSQNYHRGSSWTQMGFDKNYFIEDFTELEFYANRVTDNRCTDISALKNVIRFYDEMPEDQPRFVFLATMQNHGGWTLNTPDQALVHASIQTDNATLPGKVDEFLSCISLTDEMIPFMQQYFNDQYARTGRKVIICMCGDHSPSFIKSLDELCKWENPMVAERKGRSTPYFIWANYPLQPLQMELPGTEDMDLCCLMPTALELAGIPMSYYYRFICDLRPDVATFTNVGTDISDGTGSGEPLSGTEPEANEDSDSVFRFCDKEGRIHELGEDSSLAQRIRDYMYMEYNLNGDSNGLEWSLFLPKGVEESAD